MPFGFRPDGDLVKDLPPTRAIMPFIMPTRAESTVYYEVLVDTARLHPFLARVREQTGLKVTLMHVVVAAAARALHERPRLNRFVAGSRIWQRRGIWMSLSVKTEKSDKGSVVARKRKIDPTQDLAGIVRSIDGVVGASRSGTRDQTDRELALVLALPTFMTRLIINGLRALDRWGLMPRFMIDGDPLFTSMFVANVGSIGMDAPFHHLFEWGNCPLFCSIGLQRDDGKVPLRFTFDERVEDGLYCLKSIELLQKYVEDPGEAFGM